MMGAFSGSLIVVATILSAKDANVRTNYFMLNLAVSNLVEG